MPFGRMPVGTCAGAPRGTRALVLPGTLLPQMSQAPPRLWVLLQAAFPENELEADVGRAVVVDEAAAHRQHELAEQPQASERAEWQRGGGCAARGRMLGGAGGGGTCWMACIAVALVQYKPALAALGACAVHLQPPQLRPCHTHPRTHPPRLPGRRARRTISTLIRSSCCCRAVWRARCPRAAPPRWRGSQSSSRCVHAWHKVELCVWWWVEYGAAGVAGAGAAPAGSWWASAPEPLIFRQAVRRAGEASPHTLLQCSRAAGPDPPCCPLCCRCKACRRQRTARVEASLLAWAW